jgi:hypothetical protein
MSQTELQEATVENNEQDEDNFSIVDGVEELCLDASGEIEKLQGSQEQHKWDEIAEKLAALEQKHHDEIAELKVLFLNRSLQIIIFLFTDKKPAVERGK